MRGNRDTEGMLRLKLDFLGSEEDEEVDASRPSSRSWLAIIVRVREHVDVKKAGSDSAELGVQTTRNVLRSEAKMTCQPIADPSFLHVSVFLSNSCFLKWCEVSEVEPGTLQED